MNTASKISKLLLILLILTLLFFLLMDCNLYFRIQNYPIRAAYENASIAYQHATWIGCDINPLCDVTVKGLLLDDTNYYLFGPFVRIIDDLIAISSIEAITPNAISCFHILVALLSAKCVSSDSLSYRRMGVLLFEVRTILDDLDGHVARVRKHVKGEHSEIGSSGYYVDGACDALGCTALMIGAFIFLKNNPPRRGYIQLPTSQGEKEVHVTYKSKIASHKACKKLMVMFVAQTILSSMAWNRYIALYQDMLEGDGSAERQSAVFRSSAFFGVAWLWRLVNIHNMLHCFLVAVLCDKLWEFLRNVQYVGFGALLFVIGLTEVHLTETKTFLEHGTRTI